MNLTELRVFQSAKERSKANLPLLDPDHERLRSLRRVSRDSPKPGPFAWLLSSSNNNPALLPWLTLGDGDGLEAVQLPQQAAALGRVEAVDEVAGALRRVQRLHGLLLGVGPQRAGQAQRRGRPQPGQSCFGARGAAEATPAEDVEEAAATAATPALESARGPGGGAPRPRQPQEQRQAAAEPRRRHAEAGRASRARPRYRGWRVGGREALLMEPHTPGGWENETGGSRLSPRLSRLPLRQRRRRERQRARPLTATPSPASRRLRETAAASFRPPKPGRVQRRLELLCVCVCGGGA